MGLEIDPSPEQPDLNQPDSYNQRVLDMFTWIAVTLVNRLESLTPEEFFQVQSSATDTTADRLLKLSSDGKGSFGLGVGSSNPEQITDFKDPPATGFYRYLGGSGGSAAIDNPDASAFWGACLVSKGLSGDTAYLAQRNQGTTSSPRAWLGACQEDGTQLKWVEIITDKGGQTVNGDFTVGEDFTVDTNTFYVDSVNDRVGIKDLTPSYDLDVKGTTQIIESVSQPALRVANTNASLSAELNFWFPTRAASSDWNFLLARSGGGSGDAEFRLSGDGNGSCDGSWTGGGADYAEWFEWLDGNPLGEDRRGFSVVLDGDKIRPATTGEAPIGVISANPSVVGDGDIDRWKGKYLRDDFAAYIWEDYEVVSWTEIVTETDPVQGQAVEPEERTLEVSHSYAADEVPDGVTVPADAERVTQQRRKLNPAYDPAQEYIPRSERPEWDMVGLMGKLRLRKGQPVAQGWIKMRDVSAEVEEWLVK